MRCPGGRCVGCRNRPVLTISIEQRSGGWGIVLTAGSINSPAANPTFSPARIVAVLGAFQACVALRPHVRSGDVGSVWGFRMPYGGEELGSGETVLWERNVRICEFVEMGVGRK